MSDLLDTSALLAHYRGEQGSETVQRLFDGEGPLLLCSVSLPEFGRRLRTLGEPEDSVAETLASYRLLFDSVVSVDEELASQSFHLICSLPERLPLVDAFIATAARSSSARLVHRDKHMRRIPTEVLACLDLESNSGA